MDETTIAESTKQLTSQESYSDALYDPDLCQWKYTTPLINYSCQRLSKPLDLTMSLWQVQGIQEPFKSHYGHTVSKM